MEARRLQRLVQYRRQLERVARIALEEAMGTLQAVKDRKDACDRVRLREEASLGEMGSANADELRRAYEYLFKLDMEAKRLQKHVQKEEAEVEQKREELREARRQVKQLEVLMERDAARTKLRVEKRAQAMLDAFAIRAHEKGEL